MMSGYSAKEAIPPGPRLPTESGVPRLPPMRQVYEEDAARPAEQAALQIASMARYAEALCPSPPRESLIERHCLSEARREVESWWSAEIYRWREFEIDPLDMVEPLQYSMVLR